MNHVARLRSNIGSWLVAATLAIAVGAASGRNLQLAFVATLGVVGCATLAAPAGVWVACALVAALTFKGLVSLGLLPSVATFADLPLAWGAVFVALSKRRPHSHLLVRHLRWLAALAFAMSVAWAFNRSEVLRPVVYFMLLAEPFAIVAALMAEPPSPRVRLVLERTILGLLLIQLPVVAFEILRFGVPSDRIQGTIYGAGAGAHVISAVTVVGGIWIVSAEIARRSLRTWRFPIAAALWLIPFAADAKQVIVVTPIIVLASTSRVGRGRLFGRAALAAALVFALFALDPAGKTALGFIEQSDSGKGGKEAVAGFVWRHLEGDPAAIAFGKGPAETVSRAAFMTTPLFQASGSPLAVLGLKPAPIAMEAQTTALAISGGGTSFNGGTSSALGVLGDLGLIGVIAYLGLVTSLFLRLRNESSGAAGFAMFIVLGFVFDWWEQPPFGVFLGVLAGLSLALTQFTKAESAREFEMGGQI